MNGRRVEKVPERREKSYGAASKRKEVAGKLKTSTRPQEGKWARCAGLLHLLSRRRVHLLELLEHVHLKLGRLAVLVDVLDDLQRQNLVTGVGVKEIEYMSTL